MADERKLSRLPRMAEKKPERQFKVGQRIQKSLSGGQIEPAVVKAVVRHTDGTRLQVDFGHEQTALIHSWQLVEE
jgi:hypothetical protein